MKILMISAYPDQSERIVGGVAGVTYYLTSELASRSNIQISVLNPFAPIEAPAHYTLKGVEVTAWPIWKGPAWTRLMYTEKARQIANFADQGNFDIVHMQGEPTFSRFVKTPLVTTLHGIQERDTVFRGRAWLRSGLWSRFLRLREGYFRRQLKNIIVISPYVRHIIGKELRGQCWDIENPVRSDFFEIQRRPIPGRIYFGGTLNPRKNIEGLIRALATVRQTVPHAELRIGGHTMFTDYEKRCKALAMDLGVAGATHFLGGLNVEQVKEELSHASVLALCSFQETAPLVIEEAMAAGVPVLASKICGIPWMIDEGKTGLLVNPASDHEIAHGMTSMLQEPRLDQWGVQAQLVAQRFRVQTIADQTLEVYDHVLRHNR